MADTEKNVEVPEVAPQGEDTQSEQVAATDDAADAPSIPEEKEEKILGKFNSQEDLEKSYQESESKLTQTLQEKAELERALQQAMSTPETGYPQTESVNTPPQLDPEVVPALDQYTVKKYAELRSAEKAVEFVNKHQDELKDPVLDGTVRRLIAEKRMNGQDFDQEDILAEAYKLLEARTKPQIKDAKTEGVAEGKEIAHKKEQAGAVGETGAREKVDESKLSSKEYAEYHGLKYSE